MRKTRVDIWIPKSIMEDMVREADGHFPNETGGNLMGYFNRDKKIVVVTELIGSGPKAKHHRYSFVPDYEFQEKQIEQVYFHSHRMHTYLGDWHTHPNGGASLSAKDKGVLENIAKYKKARAPFPIMILLAGIPNGWEMKSWQLKPKRLMKIVLTTGLIELDNKFY